MSDSNTCRETWERFEPKNSKLTLEISPFLVLSELAKWDAINEAFFKLEWLQIQGWNKSFDLRKQIRSLKKLVTVASSHEFFYGGKLSIILKAMIYYFDYLKHVFSHMPANACI